MAVPWRMGGWWTLCLAWRDLTRRAWHDDSAIRRAVRLLAVRVGRVCGVHCWLERLDLVVWFYRDRCATNRAVFRSARAGVGRERPGSGGCGSDCVCGIAVARNCLGEQHSKPHELT